jgi:hypothetical protein
LYFDREVDFTSTTTSFVRTSVAAHQATRSPEYSASGSHLNISDGQHFKLNAT